MGRKTKAVVLRIREPRGTYYRGMTGIGPMFGATRDNAIVFTDGWEAYDLMKSFPLLVDADLVNERGEPCDITGQAIRRVKPARKAKKGRKAQ